jgi:transposase InsO family protein
MATVIDCHTKAVIGWAVDDNYRTPLIQQAIEMGARNYPLAESAIFILIAAATTRPASSPSTAPSIRPESTRAATW